VNHDEPSNQLKVFMFIFINLHSRAMAFPSRPGKRPTLADIVSRPGSAVGARRPQDAAVAPPPPPLPPKTQPPAEQVQMDGVRWNIQQQE